MCLLLVSPEATRHCPDKSLRHTVGEGIRRGEALGAEPRTVSKGSTDK